MTKLPHDHGEHPEDIIPLFENGEHFLMLSELFRQFSDGNRIRLFWILCHCEECVINLSAMMNMSSPAISHHLKQLKSAGLITGRRSGKEVYYRAADTPVVKALHDAIRELSELSCPGGCLIPEEKK